jgi:hypothetical protein
MEVGNRAAIDPAEALMDDERLRFQILQVRIHPEASRQSARWFPTPVALSFRGGSSEPSPESITVTLQNEA